MRRITFADTGLTEGAAAMNRVFEHYLIPVAFNAEQLQLHVSYNDVDRGASPLWLDDSGNVAAAALLGIRGDRGWIGGFGVAPEYRGKGYAKDLLAEIASTARMRGLKTIALEVLVGNSPAIALYRGAGFEIQRNLLSFQTTGSGAELSPPFSHVAPDTYIAEPDVVRPSWQRERATLRNGAVSSGVADHRGNYALFRRNDRLAQVLKLRAESAAALNALATGVSAGHPGQTILILNEPEESPIVELAQTAGWNRPFEQHEMLLQL